MKKHIPPEWVSYYAEYWKKQWALAKPHMCEYCHHRVECLLESEPPTSWCTQAWNKLVYTEGPQF